MYTYVHTHAPPFAPLLLYIYIYIYTHISAYIYFLFTVLSEILANPLDLLPFEDAHATRVSSLAWGSM